MLNQEEIFVKFFLKNSRNSLAVFSLGISFWKFINQNTTFSYLKWLASFHCIWVNHLYKRKEIPLFSNVWLGESVAIKSVSRMFEIMTLSIDFHNLSVKSWLRNKIRNVRPARIEVEIIVAWQLYIQFAPYLGRQLLILQLFQFWAQDVCNF